MILNAQTHWHRPGLFTALNWAEDDLRLVLLGTQISNNVEFYDDITSELGVSTNYPALGYQVGGRQLPNRNVQQIQQDIRLLSDDVVWNQLAGAARIGVIVNFTLIEEPIIAVVDFMEVVQGDIAPVRVRWENRRVLVARTVTTAEGD
jgi:hypothetical protein